MGAKGSKPGMSFKKALTKFEVNEHYILQETFAELAAMSPGDTMDMNTFQRFFNLAPLLAEQLFKIFDRKANSVLDYEEFLIGVAVVCKGSFEDRIRFCFAAFDLRSDDCISPDEMRTILKKIYTSNLLYTLTGSEQSVTSGSVQDTLSQINGGAIASAATTTASAVPPTSPPSKVKGRENAKSKRRSKGLNCSPSTTRKGHNSKDAVGADKRTAGVNNERGATNLDDTDAGFGVTGDSGDALRRAGKSKSFNVKKLGALVGGRKSPSPPRQIPPSSLPSPSPSSSSSSSPPPPPVPAVAVAETEPGKQPTTTTTTTSSQSTNSLSQAPSSPRSSPPLSPPSPPPFPAPDASSMMDSGPSLSRRSLDSNKIAEIDQMVKDAFERCDLNHDGRLSYRQFKLWAYSKPEVFDFFQKILSKATLLPDDRHTEDLEAVAKHSELKDFILEKIVGCGRYGKVYRCKHITTGHLFAVKVMSKKFIQEDKQFSAVRLEKEISSSVKHRFLVRTFRTFRDATKLYMLMEYVPCGTLHRKLRHDLQISPVLARMYAAEIALAMDHLHKQNVVHRDIKLDNILVTRTGHIKLTDMGFAKYVRKGKEKTFTFLGTPEYTAPEIIRGEGYGREVDWWAFGIVVFKMIAGFSPFFKDSGNQEEIYDQIVAFNGKLNFPDVVDSDARKLISRLLDVKVTTRLGCGKDGFEEVKHHPFFRGVNWSELQFGKQSVRTISVKDGESVEGEHVGDREQNSYFATPDGGDYTGLPPGTLEQSEEGSGESKSTKEKYQMLFLDF